MHNTEEKKHYDPCIEPAVRSYERSRLAEQQENEKPLSEKMTMYVDETKTVQFEHTDKMQQRPTIWQRQQAREAARKVVVAAAHASPWGQRGGMTSAAYAQAARTQNVAFTPCSPSLARAFQEQP